MAAAVADFRPGRGGRRQAQEGRAAPTLDARWSAPTTSSRARRRAPPGPDARRLRRRARRAARSPTAATSSTRKGLDAIVVNDIGRRDIGFDATTTRSRSSRPPASATCRGRRRRRRAGGARHGRPTRRAPARAAASRATAPLSSRARSRRRDRARDRPWRSSRRVAPRRAGAVEVRQRAARPGARRIAAEGHILLEDLPGVGKTTLARALARSLELQFARVQCTADLLPADIVGTNVYNQRESRFEFRPGPIFANVVLVDEINRASPKTQSGPARVHAGTQRHGRRPHASAAAAVHRARDAEPGRVRGHLPAAGGAARPLHGAPVARLPVRRGRGRDAPLARGRRPRRPRRAGRDRRRRAGRPGRGPPRVRLRRAAHLRRLAARPHARGPAGRAGREPPRRACCCCAPRRRGRCCAAATTRSSTTSRRSRPPCSPTASSSPPRRWRRPASGSWPTPLATTPAL